MRLVNSIFWRTFALLACGVLLTGAALFMSLARHSQAIAQQEAEAHAVFLAGQSMQPVLLDDRVSLKFLLAATVERGAADYAWLERRGVPFVHTFAPGVPRGLLALHAGAGSGVSTRAWQDQHGLVFVDIAAPLPQPAEVVLHLGVTRERLGRGMAGALPVVVAIGLLMLTLGAGLARFMARAITREADDAKQKVVDSERRLQTIIDMEPECVKILAPDGSLLQMNRAGLAMIEADNAEQVLGRKVSGIVVPEQRAAFEAFNQRVNRGEPGTLEFEIVGFRGGHRWLETHAVPLRGNDGRIAGLLGVTRDMTARRRVEEDLRLAKEAAEAANRAKSQFLATMSHEIRTPMNGVLGMAQLLMDKGVGAEDRIEYARIIYDSGRSLLAILNDILDFSKVEAGKIEIERVVFAPAQVLGEIGDLFAESARQKGIALDVAWRGGPAQRYRGDPMRLHQILSNLVGNGIKFSDGGRIGLYAEEAGRADGEALLCFYVDDQGMGIAPERAHLLFQPFSQLDTDISRRFGGTGLGLAIAQSLVRLMGGEIGVESSVGKGSTFWFTVRVDVVDAAKESGGGEGIQATVPAAQPDGGGRRILVVEDVAVNRRVIEAMLGKMGYAVEAATNGREAVATVTAGTNYDLVLMDCQMPEMDGLEATRRIRQWESEKRLPPLTIVALTAGVFAEDREQCQAAGMDDFLAKPVDQMQLHALLGKRFGQAAA